MTLQSIALDNMLFTVCAVAGNSLLLQSELRTRPKISQKLSQLIRYDPTPANPKTLKKKKKKASSL